MKKKIVIGSLLSVFVLTLLPLISAVEFSATTGANISNLPKQLQTIDTEELKERIKEGRYPIILTTLVHLILQIIEETILPGWLLMPLACILALIIHLGVFIGIFDSPGPC